MHHHHSREHGKNGKRGSGRVSFLLVILLNILITAAEYIGGVISGSLALISDAGHNLSDVLALLLGYAGERVSEKKPDSRYTFGLKRFEVLVALINALSLIVIGVYIVYEAVHRYLHPGAIDPGIMIPVAVIGLLGNLFSIFILRKDRDKNLNLKAAFLHLLYDAVSSVAVIAAGIVLYYTGLVIFDLVVSMLIVFMIVWSSVDILKECFRIFLQGTPGDIDTDDVYRNILLIKNVGSVHGLHIWSVNSSEVFLSCHICTDNSLEDICTDEIINDVNSMLEDRYRIRHTTIQVERMNLCESGGTCCS